MIPTYYCKYVIFKAEMKTDKQFSSWYQERKMLPALFLASFLLLAVPAP